jgi:hypothetical protein
LIAAGAQAPASGNHANGVTNMSDKFNDQITAIMNDAADKDFAAAKAEKKTGSAIVWNEGEIKTAYAAANIGASLRDQFKALFSGLDASKIGTDAYKLQFKAVQNNATVGYFIKRMFPNQGIDYTEEQELKSKALVLKVHGQCTQGEMDQRRNARAWVFDGLKKAEIESPFAKAKISDADKAVAAAKRASIVEAERKETIAKDVQVALSRIATKLPDHTSLIHALERNAQVMLQLLTVNDWILPTDPARKLVERFAKDLLKLSQLETKEEKITA